MQNYRKKTNLQQNLRKSIRFSYAVNFEIHKNCKITVYFFICYSAAYRYLFCRVFCELTQHWRWMIQNSTKYNHGDTWDGARKQAPRSLGDWWEAKCISWFTFNARARLQMWLYFFKGCGYNALVGTSIKVAEITKFSINVIWRQQSQKSN